MDADSFRQAAHTAIEEIIQFNKSVSSNELPVLPSIKPGYLRPQLPTSAPTHPQPWSQIQPDISSKIIPGLTHWQSPQFMAFFPSCTTYPSILGEMYSCAFTAPAFNWLCSPACTELETIVLDWLADALHLPAEFRSDSSNAGGGVIQGSASEAIVTCMVAARERYLNRLADRQDNPKLMEGSAEREKWISQRRSRLVALSSDQAHSSTAKGARIAGTWHRTVPTRWEDELAVMPDALQRTIEECLAEGLEPYYITLSNGTTSTCAQDPVHLLNEVLEKYPDIWVHIDAAYAGTALVCPEYANATESSPSDTATTTQQQDTNAEKINGLIETNGGISTDKDTNHNNNTQKNYSPPLSSPVGALPLPLGSQVYKYASSFNTNLHKWLLTSFDASLLYVRNRYDLTSALSITPAYLQNKHTDSGLVTDYRDWQIPLGRRFRALKIWFVVRSYGILGLREHIRRTVRVGMYFEGLVRGEESARELFEIVSRPAFGLTCFRVREEVVKKALDQEGRTSSGDVASASSNSRVVELNGGKEEENVETESTIDGSPFGTNEQIDQQQQQQKQQEQGPQKDIHKSTSSSSPSSPSSPSSLTEITNTLTKNVVETINDTGKLFLTSSSTHDKSFIRVVCGNENASEEYMKAAFEMIVDVTRGLLKDLKEK